MAETRVSLIRRVRDRADDVAWSEFFTIYQPLLISYARSQGVSESDATDLVQDVFTRLIPAMTRFEFDPNRGRFRTWLWRVTNNALTDWARRRAARDRAEQGWVDRHPSMADSASATTWDRLYRQRMLEVALERVRDSTLPTTWACFEGRILAGRPAAEIAAELDVSTNVVYVNASRVLARLREVMAEFEEQITSS